MHYNFVTYEYSNLLKHTDAEVKNPAKKCPRMEAVVAENDIRKDKSAPLFPLMPKVNQ